MENNNTNKVISDTIKRKQKGIVHEAAKTGREIGQEMARQDVKWLHELSKMFLGWMKLILFGWMFSRLIDLLCVIL